MQFFVGIGGAIVITIVMFAAVAAGIQIRGAAWIIVFLCIWLLTFVALRLRLHSLIWGFAFGSFIQNLHYVHKDTFCFGDLPNAVILTCSRRQRNRYLPIEWL